MGPLITIFGNENLVFHTNLIRVFLLFMSLIWFIVSGSLCEESVRPYQGDSEINPNKLQAQKHCFPRHARSQNMICIHFV